jgi:hypothetical protein
LIDRWKASGQSVAAFCAAHVPDATAEVILPTGLIVRVSIGTDPVAVARRIAAFGSGAC